MKNCAYCGHQNSDAALGCQECGSEEFKSPNLAEASPKAQEPASSTPQSQSIPPSPTWKLSDFLPRGASKASFILVMVCYSFTVSSLVSALARAFHLPPPPIGYLKFGSPVITVTALLLLAPLIESLLLVGAIELAKVVRSPPWFQVAAAAVLISAMHSTTWRPHGLIVAPSFAIQAAAYLYWRPASRKTAFGIVACIHALHNLIPAISTIAYANRHV
jgi:hypothetical protein